MIILKRLRAWRGSTNNNKGRFSTKETLALPHIGVSPKNLVRLTPSVPRVHISRSDCVCGNDAIFSAGFDRHVAPAPMGTKVGVKIKVQRYKWFQVRSYRRNNKTIRHQKTKQNRGHKGHAMRANHANTPGTASIPPSTNLSAKKYGTQLACSTPTIRKLHDTKTFINQCISAPFLFVTTVHEKCKEKHTTKSDPVPALRIL